MDNKQKQFQIPEHIVEELWKFWISTGSFNAPLMGAYGEMEFGVWRAGTIASLRPMVEGYEKTDGLTDD